MPACALKMPLKGAAARCVWPDAGAAARPCAQGVYAGVNLVDLASSGGLMGGLIACGLWHGWH